MLEQKKKEIMAMIPSDQSETAISINDGEHYLSIQACDSGWDYTCYDQNFALLDGGQTDDPVLPIAEIVCDLLEEFGFADDAVSMFNYEELAEKVCG